MYTKNSRCQTPENRSEWLRSETQGRAVVGEDVKKEEHSTIAGGIENWRSEERRVGKECT